MSTISRVSPTAGSCTASRTRGRLELTQYSWASLTREDEPTLVVDRREPVRRSSHVPSGGARRSGADPAPTRAPGTWPPSRGSRPGRGSCPPPRREPGASRPRRAGRGRRAPRPRPGRSGSTQAPERPSRRSSSTALDRYASASAGRPRESSRNPRTDRFGIRRRISPAASATRSPSRASSLAESARPRWASTRPTAKWPSDDMAPHVVPLGGRPALPGVLHGCVPVARPALQLGEVVSDLRDAGSRRRAPRHHQGAR